MQLEKWTDMLSLPLPSDFSIQTVEHAKNLGLIFNTRIGLAWTEHINVICDKTYVQKIIEKLYRVRHLTFFSTSAYFVNGNT